MVWNTNFPCSVVPLLKEEVAYKKSSRCKISKISTGHAAVLMNIIMATSEPQPSARFTLHLQMSFSSQEEKDIFVSRFDEAKRLLVPDGIVKRSTLSVLNAMLDRVLTELRRQRSTRALHINLTH